MTKLAVSNYIPEIEWRSARLGKVRTMASQVKVEVTFWSKSGVPTFRTFTLRTTAKDRYWRLVEEVCLLLKDLGLTADDVSHQSFHHSTDGIRYLFQHSEPESLSEWLCTKCGGSGEYEDVCNECGGGGGYCEFCDGEGTVWLPCYHHEYI